MMAFLKLIRFQNLLIIAATQYMMRFFVLAPILAVNGFEPQLDQLHFFLLVFSSISITAAGYVINDYFDMKTDLLNRPSTVIVGRLISRRRAMILHILLNSLGVLTGVYLSWHVDLLGFGVAYVLAAGLLWFYSTTYKRQFLIGNLIVSIFTAVVPFVVVLFEVPLLNKTYGEIMIAREMNFNHLIAWVGGFSFFAFLSTLIREIIKDVEDFEGDAEYGRNTLPIVLGIRATKILVIGLVIFLIFSLGYIYYKHLSRKPGGEIDLLSLLWFTLMMILPFVYLVFRLIAARDKKEYHFCSNLTKVIMLNGILYSVIFYIIIHPYIP
jgi:4-hydroxybenzoate polyprenyltransferase